MAVTTSSVSLSLSHFFCLSPPLSLFSHFLVMSYPLLFTLHRGLSSVFVFSKLLSCSFSLTFQSLSLSFCLPHPLFFPSLSLSLSTMSFSALYSSYRSASLFFSYHSKQTLSCSFLSLCPVHSSVYAGLV